MTSVLNDGSQNGNRKFHGYIPAQLMSGMKISTVSGAYMEDCQNGSPKGTQNASVDPPALPPPPSPHPKP